jgi:hypothetical protein
VEEDTRLMGWKTQNYNEVASTQIHIEIQQSSSEDTSDNFVSNI